MYSSIVYSFLSIFCQSAPDACNAQYHIILSKIVLFFVYIRTLNMVFLTILDYLIVACLQTFSYKKVLNLKYLVPYFIIQFSEALYNAIRSAVQYTLFNNQHLFCKSISMYVGYVLGLNFF